jgi:hypothetical protein
MTSIGVTPAAVATVPAAASMASAVGRESIARDESAAQY